MQAYLVGGAVRDRLLGLPVHDRDWVVVGRTQEQMIADGYRQVGSDFPVFLHPDTHEEYALARTERKTAPGYRGFSIHADPDVTLEEDLERRDITINAIAQENDGTLIDPFNGERDLKDRILRHVSTAFAEDPVRILRVARFAARLQPFGFTVADETLELMRQMVDAGEVDALVPERVWQELRGALASAKPSVFINVLRDANALQTILPEVEALFGVPQPEEHHPEIDSGIHTLMVVDLAASLAATSFNQTDDEAEAAQQRAARIVFAALCHDFGKALTPKEEWPSHRGHEKSGVPVVEALCNRLRTPADVRKLSMTVCFYHLHCHRAKEMKPGKLVKTLSAIDALRRPQRLEEFLLVCEADYRGRGSGERKTYPQAAHMQRVLEAMRSVDAGAIAASQAKLVPDLETKANEKAGKKADKNRKPDSEKIKNAIHQARVQAVKAALGDDTINE